MGQHGKKDSHDQHVVQHNPSRVAGSPASAGRAGWIIIMVLGHVSLLLPNRHDLGPHIDVVPDSHTCITSRAH